MEQIYEPNDKFDFSRLTLSAPIFINSGNYFIKYQHDNAPLYIQAPKCITKQGVIKGGKKMYCDFLFTNENESFIRWIESLENYSQKYIYENRAKWFENELEMHDIENSFTSPLKIYKSGKFYIIRTIVPTRLGKCILKIYDENEMDLDIEHIHHWMQAIRQSNNPMRTMDAFWSGQLNSKEWLIDNLNERVYFGVDVDILDRKSTRLNSSHIPLSRMPSSA